MRGYLQRFNNHTFEPTGILFGSLTQAAEAKELVNTQTRSISLSTILQHINTGGCLNLHLRAGSDFTMSQRVSVPELDVRGKREAFVEAAVFV